MEACYHFVTGEFVSHRRFMPDKEYGEALDNFSKGCSDMLLTDSKDWWYVGGRILPGESPAASCSRLLKRELSLDIAPDRFSTICCNSLVWGMRQQEPQNNGTCDVNIVLTVQLSDEEAARVVLDEAEYSDSKWITCDELLQGDYHPALKLSARSMLARRAQAALSAAVAAGAADGEIARLARELCAVTQPPPLGKSGYELHNDVLGYRADVHVSLC